MSGPGRIIFPALTLLHSWMSDSLSRFTEGVRILRPYEILVIVDARPTDEEVAGLLTQLGEQLKGLSAEVTKVENWGKRRLAYDIRKQREGTYAVFEVSAEPAMVKEFERQLRLNESVLRFLSTRVPIRKKARPAKTPEVLEEVG
jgi:small subunit ribosomal protein S6